MIDINQYVPKGLNRTYSEISNFISSNPKSKIGILIFVVFSSVYVGAKYSESERIVYKDSRKPVFEEGRILGTQASSYLKSKELLLSKTARKIMLKNKALEEKMKLLEKRIEAKS